MRKLPSLWRRGLSMGSWHVLAAGRLSDDAINAHASTYMEGQDRRTRFRAATPLVPGYGLFGASELIEGQAHTLEALVLNQMQLQFGHESLGPPGMILFGPRSEIPAVYTVAATVFARTLGRRELSKDDLNTFLAVVDYALATPLHPIFGYQLEPTSPPQWRDLHPGWRFLTLCKAVARVGTMGNASITLDPHLYDDFITRVAEHVGWLSPVEMARRFIAHFPDGHADTWQDAFFLTASALRVEHPTVFVHYLFDDAERASLLRDRIASPIVRNGDNVLLGGWADATEEERMSATRDWLNLSDGYRVADAIAFGGARLDDLSLAAHEYADQLLRKRWGVTQDDFRSSE
ncbi:MAG: hypothetical protein JWR63_140 [Conexibacter sp.]|nr:hypothetical protein [Conexibacter sp.]